MNLLHAIGCSGIGLAGSLLMSSVLAQSAADAALAERLASLQMLREAAAQTPLTHEKLQSLCRGLDGARWCEGYIAAYLEMREVPLACLPRTDLAPFMHGQVWEMTLDWLSRQPRDERFTVLQALNGAFAEQTRCPMGSVFQFGQVELTPYTVAELEELRRCSDMRPLVDVVPNYPPQALRENLQGWVQLSFTVTELGGVRDIAVVDADPPMIFDQAALDAAQRLQYRGCASQGVVSETPNVQYVFRFVPEVP